MSHEMLAWQTKCFRLLSLNDDDLTLMLRSDQAVEIALVGVQRSSRYPRGVTIRFAHVVRYRGDKAAGEDDTIKVPRSILTQS